MTAVKPVSAGSVAPTVCKTFTTAEDRLEAEIKAASDRMCAASEREEKLRHWREMVRLIDQRTPARVRFMERMAGLRGGENQ